jgi:hypothetical protein
VRQGQEEGDEEEGALTMATRTRAVAVCAAAVLAIGVQMGALTAGVAAANTSRAEYREAAEPICKTDTKANERILAGVKSEVRSGMLAPASVKFMKASKALTEALHQLEGLPRPSADAARLSKWFGTVKTEAGYFEAVGKKLKAGQKSAAERLVTKLEVTANKANNQVLPFEFTYCRLEPSRFT